MRADEMRVGSLTEGNMFLGAGGRTPRVDILGDDAAQVETLLELPEGHSAYAIDVSPDGTSIAVGTKEGDLYIVSFADDSDRAQDQYVAKLIQGAPILSACFVDNTQVAVSDVAGRCLLSIKMNHYECWWWKKEWYVLFWGLITKALLGCLLRASSHFGIFRTQKSHTL